MPLGPQAPTPLNPKPLEPCLPGASVRVKKPKASSRASAETLNQPKQFNLNPKPSPTKDTPKRERGGRGKKKSAKRRRRGVMKPGREELLASFARCSRSAHGVRGGQGGKQQIGRWHEGFELQDSVSPKH